MRPQPATKPYVSLEAEADSHFQRQKRHFFDRMELTGDDFLRQPLWLDRTDFYVTKLPPPDPDSMILLLETVFKKLEPNREAYQYYFRYMMNSLSRMSRYRTDEVFVHFMRKYVDTGKANWISESDLGKYKTDATRMEPLFAGKKAPDVTLYDKDSKEVSLYNIESPYPVVAFWRYDCSHCNKEMPVVKQDDLLARSEDYVGVTGKIARVQAEPKSHRAEKVADSRFGLGVLASDQAHSLAALGLGQGVDHAPRPTTTPSA